MGTLITIKQERTMQTFSIQDFFAKLFETESTRLLLENPSIFSTEAMENYICIITEIPLQEYINYSQAHPLCSEITSKDITQLSSIEDCTINMCNLMIERGNCGLSLPEIASGLHADNNYKDNLVALTKYGENQVKTASQLGLSVFWKDLWYLTSVGYVFPQLKDEQRYKYLAINLIRDPFYNRVIDSLCKRDTCLMDFMGILSESTQKRRSSSCSRVISFFISQCRCEGVNIYSLKSK